MSYLVNTAMLGAAKNEAKEQRRKPAGAPSRQPWHAVHKEPDCRVFSIWPKKVTGKDKGDAELLLTTPTVHSVT